MIQLRPYQVEAVEAVEEAARRGVRRSLIALPTGLGKTLVFAEIVKRRGGRALIVAHTEELIAQAAAKMRMAMSGASVGIVKAGRDEHGARIVVASIQTISRMERLGRMDLNYRTVVVDEAHHSRADTYQAVLDRLGVYEQGGPLLVGVTATPERGDRRGLGKIFEEISYSKSLLWGIRSGYLADLRGIRVTLDGLNLDKVATSRGDYAEGQLGEAMDAADAPVHAVAAWQEHAAGLKTLAFTAGVQQAHATAAAFRAAGIPSVAIDGTTPAGERGEALGAFRRGEITVLANCGVLTEGFDEPGIACLLMARPTKSRGAYAQMVGRGTRKSPGKTDCLVIDLAGNTSLRLASVAKLCDIDPEVEAHKAKSGKPASVLEMVAEQESRTAAAKLASQVVDLFAGRELHWVRGDKLWTLGAGEGQVVMREDAAGTWSVSHVARVFEDGSSKWKSTLIAEGLDLQYAQGTAEDFVRGLGDEAMRLAKADAPWRSAPASEAQLAILRRRGGRLPAGLTKGQASDMISGRIAARAGKAAS